MIKIRVIDTYKGKMKIKYNDDTEPSIIGVKYIFSSVRTNEIKIN